MRGVRAAGIGVCVCVCVCVCMHRAGECQMQTAPLLPTWQAILVDLA